MKLAYIAGAITAPTENERLDNIRRAVDVAGYIAGLGYAVHCPHSHGEMLNALYPQPYEYWIETDLLILPHCQLLVLVPGWERSPGVQRELAAAEDHHIFVWYNYLDVPPIEREEDKGNDE